MYNPQIVTATGEAVGGILAARDAAARYAALPPTPAWPAAPPPPPETPEEREARLAVQREAVANRARAEAERAESDRVTMGALARGIARLEQELAARDLAADRVVERGTNTRSRFRRARRTESSAPAAPTDPPAPGYVDGGRAFWQLRRLDGETRRWRPVEFLELDTRVDLDGRCSVDESRLPFGVSDLALGESGVETVKAHLARRHSDLDWRASGYGPVTLRASSDKTSPPAG